MKEDERRYTPRFKMHIPLRIRPVAHSETPSQAVESSDISARGVYFSTDLPLLVGSPIQMFLQMPEEVTGKALINWCCTCRVVRVDSAAMPSGKAGVGVEIQYYEVLKN
jgi:hypothetical protein